MARLILTFTLLLLVVPEGMGENSPFKEGMENLVSQLSRNDAKIQTFHIGYDNKNQRAIVYWPENRMLYLFPKLALDDPHWKNPVLLWQEIIDTETGVVANPEDIGSSTYLETAEQVARLVRIATEGKTFIVRAI